MASGPITSWQLDVETVADFIFGGWMASLTRWTWVWVNSRRWCWTGRPGMLWFIGSQKVSHDWATELNWTELNWTELKITTDGACSHEIKRCLLLGRKVLTNLDSILKSRDITLPTKICLVKAMIFPVVRYGCESWTIKKAECWRIDAFELWCWRRLLRASWTARKSHQSILKEINLEYSLEGLMLKLKLH